MRRAAVILGLALAACTLGGAAAAPINWRSLPYYDWYNARLFVSTDRTWAGARRVDAGNLNLQKSSSWPKVNREWIWSATCGQHEQTVVFSKTFLVPGAPAEGTLDLYYGPGNQYLGNRPYESAIYEINGVEIGRLGNIGRFPRTFAAALSAPLSARGRAAFHHGLNKATIRVVRAALKPGDPCTHPNTSGNVRFIAVAADLSLTFGADLIAIPPRTTQQIRRVVNGQNVILQGSSGVANFGPSTSLGGTVQLTAGGDGQTVLVPNVTHGNAPLDDCKLEGNAITCTYAELQADTRTAIDVTAGIKVNTGYFKNGVGELTLQWSITGRGADANGSNNTTQTKVFLCAPGATAAPCG